MQVGCLLWGQGPVAASSALHTHRWSGAGSATPGPDTALTIGLYMYMTPYITLSDFPQRLKRPSG